MEETENRLYFRNAVFSDRDNIYALYKSVIGSEFCVWNENYPTMNNILGDLKAESVYVLCEGEKIIGAISVEPATDLEEFSCWKCSDGTELEISRVAVDKYHRGRGLSEKMVYKIAGILKAKGCNSIHLAAAKVNVPAYKTYLKAGFETVGEAQVFGGDYYLMEMLLQDFSCSDECTDGIVDVK